MHSSPSKPAPLSQPPSSRALAAHSSVYLSSVQRTSSTSPLSRHQRPAHAAVPLCRARSVFGRHHHCLLITQRAGSILTVRRSKNFVDAAAAGRHPAHLTLRAAPPKKRVQCHCSHSCGTKRRPTNFVTVVAAGSFCVCLSPHAHRPPLDRHTEVCGAGE